MRRRRADQDPHEQLHGYIARMDPSWRDRVNPVLDATLAGGRVRGYWLRADVVEDDEAGPAGTLELVVVSEQALLHIQFLALPGVEWRRVTRTRAWPLASLCSVATETLPAQHGGQDGLLVQMAPSGALLEVELDPGADRAGFGRSLVGLARPSVVRIVVEPAEADATDEQRRVQRQERALLVKVAEAVHRGLSPT